MSQDQGYLNFLQESATYPAASGKLNSRYNSNSDKITHWDGRGKLDVECDDNINSIIDKVSGSGGNQSNRSNGIQEDLEGEFSPLSLLEDEDEIYMNLDESDDLTDSVNFDSEEDDVIERLITEMDELDSVDYDDENSLDDELDMELEAEDENMDEDEDMDEDDMNDYE